MSVNYKIGQFAANTSTGNQVISGVGFQPVAIILYGCQRVGTGSQANAYKSFGVGVSTSQRWAFSNASDDGQPTGVARRRATTTKCYTMINAAGTLLMEADLVSMDSGGFTINWSTVDGNAYFIAYVAIGGDVSNAAAGRFTLNSGTGNQSITGLSFQPDIILFGTCPIATEGTTTNAMLGLGVTKSASERWSTSNITFHGPSTTNTQSYFSTNRSQQVIDITGVLEAEFDFVSHDPTGFTINVTVGQTTFIYYLALKGGQHSVGTFVAPSAEQTQVISGVGHLPKGLLLCSIQDIVADSVRSGSALSLGSVSVSDLSLQRNLWNIDLDNLADSSARQAIDHDELLQFRGAGSPWDIEFSAVLQSVSNSEFTLNWTGTLPQAYNVGYWSMGDVVVSGLPFFTTVDAKRI